MYPGSGGHGGGHGGHGGGHGAYPHDDPYAHHPASGHRGPGNRGAPPPRGGYQGGFSPTGNDFGLMAGGFGGPQSPGGPGGPRPPYGGSSSYPYSQDPYAAGAYGASGAGAGAEPYGTSEQDQMKKLLKDTFLEVVSGTGDLSMPHAYAPQHNAYAPQGGAYGNGGAYGMNPYVYPPPFQYGHDPYAQQQQWQYPDYSQQQYGKGKGKGSKGKGKGGKGKGKGKGKDKGKDHWDSARNSPKKSNADAEDNKKEEEDDIPDGPETRTTIMLRNIPNKYTQRMLLREFEERGFHKKFDFFYLPIDFRNRCNVGYAFINFVSAEDAIKFKEAFDDQRLPAYNSSKISKVCYAKVQGLAPNIENYRNSSVFGIPVPQYWPCLFKDGTQVAFPPPDAPLPPIAVRPPRS